MPVGSLAFERLLPSGFGWLLLEATQFLVVLQGKQKGEPPKKWWVPFKQDEPSICLQLVSVSTGKKLSLAGLCPRPHEDDSDSIGIESGRVGVYVGVSRIEDFLWTSLQTKPDRSISAFKNCNFNGNHQSIAICEGEIQ